MTDSADNVTMSDLLQRLDELAVAIAAPPLPTQRWLSVASAAEYADLSQESVRRLLAAGKLVARRPLKGKILIDRIEFDALIAGSTATPRTGRGKYQRTAGYARRPACKPSAVR
ncbi:MAG: helix-turn-helix domain-containing protein [Planctomycetes bacterium]|nr:helix-turn-helix domain-containing protein [Planctomycetota bacterium]